MMATAEYEDGADGNICKRRKVLSTPCDSPPLATEVGESGGWLSKLIDPAAWLLVKSASRLFSSVFGKNINTNEEIPQAKSLHIVREQGDNFVDIKLSFHYDGIDMSEQELSSRLDGIFQLEQLISQESFSKVEIDRLTELLYSRITEPSNLPLGGYKNKEYMHEDSNINLKDYVGRSKSPKAPPSTLDLNAAACLSVSPVDSVNKCMIRKPRGRSTSYKFSRSPYCKLFRMTDPKECNPYKDSNFDSTRSLKLTRPSLSNIRHSIHGQALKRSRSARDA